MRAHLRALDVRSRRGGVAAVVVARSQKSKQKQSNNNRFPNHITIIAAAAAAVVRYTVQFLRESPTYNGLSFTAEQKKARDCVSILRRQIAADATALCGGSSSRGKFLAQCVFFRVCSRFGFFLVFVFLVCVCVCVCVCLCVWFFFFFWRLLRRPVAVFFLSFAAVGSRVWRVGFWRAEGVVCGVLAWRGVLALACRWRGVA